MSLLLDSLTSQSFSPGPLLHSLTRNADWQTIFQIALRVFLVGTLCAALKAVYQYVHKQVVYYIFPTAYIHFDTEAYDWLTTYLAKDPQAQKQIRHFAFRGTDGGNQRANKTGAALVSRLEHHASWCQDNVIGQIMPAYGQTLRIKHKGNTLWITRKMKFFARSMHRTVDHFSIRTWSFQPNALREFIVDVHADFVAKEAHEIHIMHPNRINPTWRNPVARPSRPWSSVLLPGHTKEDLLEDIERFFSDKVVSWYAARGIPHRRGYLFHGAPGSGKTTLTTALASKLKMDIFVLNPSQRGMDDAKLSTLLRSCPRRSVILIEDIDCIFSDQRGSRLLVETEGSKADSTLGPEVTSPLPSAQPRSVPQMIGGTHDLAPSTVTFSGLLNAIDGVSSQEGCILIASTNHPENLDPALSRAGRFDVRVPFTNAIPSQARDLFLHFFPIEDFTQPHHANTREPLDTMMSSIEKTLGPAGGIHTQVELDKLADRFVDALFPEGRKDCVGGQNGVQVSMASLQAYLLSQKHDPVKAARDAEKWAKRLRQDEWGVPRHRSSLAVPVTPMVAAEEVAVKQEKPKIKANGKKQAES